MEFERKENGTILFKNVKILPGSFRNFAGKPDKFNPAGGKRYFHIVIDDPDFAQAMRDDGWNVRILAPREEGDTPVNYLKVSVSFPTPERNSSMRIVQFVGNNSVELTEDTVDILDCAYITKANVSIRPYYWATSGNSGTAAYLKTLHVTLEEEDFSDDYIEEDQPF